MRKLLLLVAGLLTACGAAPTATISPTLTPMIGDTTPLVPVATLAAPFDALVIDSFTDFHQAEIAMAETAQNQVEHEELRTYAETLISTRGGEIQQMTEWRAAWYPNAPATTGLIINADTGEISDDASVPFDLRFLNAMIAHLRVSVEIARSAQANIEHEELSQLAESILATQQAEITQLEAWRQAWFEASG